GTNRRLRRECSSSLNGCPTAPASDSGTAPAAPVWVRARTCSLRLSVTSTPWPSRSAHKRLGTDAGASPLPARLTPTQDASPPGTGARASRPTLAGQSAAATISQSGKALSSLHYSLAAGPHPRRELTLTPRLGSACPRLGVAAGASYTGAQTPPPARSHAAASPPIRIPPARTLPTTTL